MTSHRAHHQGPLSATQDDPSAQHDQPAEHAYRRRVPTQPSPRGVAFAELIRDARTNAGLSQDALAEQAGVARTTVIRWESGAADRPDPEQVRRICQILGVDPRKAAIVLGMLTEEEVWGAPPPRLPPEIEEVLDALQDPAITAEERGQWIEYLRFLRARGHQRRTG